MGTAGGEPKVLLNALKPMLGVVGDIKTSQEVLRVIGMMKDAEKLMSRCVYLNILKATCRQAKKDQEKKETLEKFLKIGGWGILNKWLMEFTRSENFPVLLELINVLKVMPITVELLKQGNTGKLMKQMTKLENSDVKKNATQLIKQWKEMIRGGGPGNNENQDTSSNKRNRDPDQRVGGDKPEKRPKTADSSGFMNALTNAAAPPEKRKKRKISKDKEISKTTLPLDEILSKSNNDKKMKLESEFPGGDSPMSPDMPPETDEHTGLIYISPAVEAANRALQENSDNTVIVDEGSLARKKNKKKRNITWATEDKLVQISYFELLPGERKGHHSENFSLARQHELLLEKQTLRSRRGEDKMTEMVQWSRLIPVDNAGVPNFIPGEKSREKYIQGEREKNVLAFIFLTKDSLPATPAEPDFDPDEHSMRSQPRVIPHDEDGTLFPVAKPANQQPSQPSTHHHNNLEEDKVSSPTSKNAPKKSQKNFSSEDMSPAVQNIMAHLLQNNVPPASTKKPPPNANANNINNNNGLPPNNQKQLPPSPPGQRIQNFNQPIRNNLNNNNKTTENIPSIMDGVIPNPRAPPRGMGPRFSGGRDGPPRGRGGYNQRGGPGPRPRWDGPTPQPQPMGQDEWNNYDNYDNSYDDYDNYNYNENYNENYNDSYNDNYNDNYNNTGNFRGRPPHPPSNRGGRTFGGPPPPGRNDRNVDEGGNFGNTRGGGGRGRGFHRGSGGMNRGRGGGSNNWGNGRDDSMERGGSAPRGGGRDNSQGRGRGRDKQVCQHFTRGNCRNGDRCGFFHPRR